MKRIDHSRRHFLRSASIASLAGLSVGPFLFDLSTLSAMASTTPVTDYRALVCIFLQGGNDGHGTVIATDPASFSAYTTARSGATGLAYSQADLLPINLKTPQSGRSFALNPNLTGVQNLFDSGRAAILANAGTLIAPATKSQIRSNSVPLPKSLFSHFDQTAAWQAVAADGSNRGWGGRMADLIESANTNASFTCMTTSGNALFLSGQTAFQLRVTNSGVVPINGLLQPLFGSSVGTSTLQSLITADNANLFAKEHAVVVKRSIDAQVALASAMLPAGAGGVPNPTQFLDPATGKLMDNDLASSLQTVARIIGGRAALGVSRQIFYVQLGSFDTHDNQAPRHATLLTKLGQALEYFDSVMIAAGLGNNVTTFTASDFGRTLTANSDGTDHGWGSHHFVAGGAVLGRDMYGTYPVVGADQANDLGAGRLIPTMAVEQYAGTLARWFGLSDSQVKEVFPNIVNFGTSPYLGFMG